MENGTQLTFDELIALANGGDGESQMKVGMRFLMGSHGVVKDEKEAIKWLTLAAENDNGTAQTNLAYCYENGMGVARNRELALKWLEKASDKKIPEAMTGLSDLYLKGLGVQKDVKRGLQLCEEAANLGFSEAQFRSAQLHYEGVGCKKDYKDALKWLEKAADQGHVRAKSMMGYVLMHHLGENVKDREKAVACLLDAAESGDTDAQKMLGDYYFKVGELESAYKWFSAAQKRGEAIALFFVSVFHNTGLVVSRDHDFALQLMTSFCKIVGEDKDREVFLAESSYELLCKLAYSAKNNEKYDEALEYFNKALESIEGIDDEYARQVQVLIQIASIYQENQFFGIARQIYARAKWISLREHDASLYQRVIIYELGLLANDGEEKEMKELISTALYQLEGTAHSRWDMKMTEPSF